MSDLIKCNLCKYKGTVLQMAFIFGKTLCPKCATKKIASNGRSFR